MGIQPILYTDCATWAPPLSWIMFHNLDASHISMTLQYIGVCFWRFIHVLQQPNPPSNWFQLVMLEVVGLPCPHKGQFLYHSFSMSLRGCWPHVVPVAWWWGCPTSQMRSCGVPLWHKWSQSRSYNTCRATTYFWSEHLSPKFIILESCHMLGGRIPVPHYPLAMSPVEFQKSWKRHKPFSPHCWYVYFLPTRSFLTGHAGWDWGLATPVWCTTHAEG